MMMNHLLHNNFSVAMTFKRKNLASQKVSINMCVTDEVNQNLSPKQKLLLQWHFKLGHMSFAKLQALARKGQLPEIIVTCQASLCARCRYGAAVKTPVGKTTHSQAPGREGGSGSIKSGDFYSGQ